MRFLRVHCLHDGYTACMKRIVSLSESDQTALEQMHLNGKTARQRQRAHAVLLPPAAINSINLQRFCEPIAIP